MKYSKEGVVAGLFLALICISTANANYLQPGVQYAQNKIIIAIQPPLAPITPNLINGVISTGLNDIDQLNRQYAVSVMWPLFPKAEKHGEPAMAGYYSITFNNTADLESVLAEYAKLTSIEHVEPVGIHRTNFNPNDPLISNQWAINKIAARQAWDITQGSADIALGIADTGVDWDHPDLNDNIWVNSGDPSNGVDDDGNGYVDDFHGWDWVNGVDGAPGEDDQTPDNNPMDFNGHGTHVSGIASAETNNALGVAGIGFNCKIMALRIGWEATDGLGYVQMDFAAAALYYAANEGARAVNCSWSSSNSGGIATAANYATSHNVVLVSAAGNDGNTVASYLCGRSDVIAVAATDQYDHKATFSNYGSWVDVSAPGVTIYSTIFNNTYDYMDGTSMAAPYVTGLVGLIASVSPGMSRSAIQTRIINTTVDIDALNPGYANLLGSGRINAYNAVNGLIPAPPVPTPYSPIGSVFVSQRFPVFYWSSVSGAIGYNIQIDQDSQFNSPDVDNSSITDTTFTSNVSLADGNWYWRIRSGNGAWSNFSSTQSFRVDASPPQTTTLLTPPHGHWMTTRVPYFSWQTVSDPGGSGLAKYYFQIDTDSIFANPIYLSDSTTFANYAPQTELDDNQRYYWRVRARDNAGNYSNYASSVFGIDNSAPLSPIGFSVSPSGWSNNSNFNLQWTNPVELSGVAKGLYKIGNLPISNMDTTGSVDRNPPQTISIANNGPNRVSFWLQDSVGNVDYSTYRQDTIYFDNIPPSGCMASSPGTSGNLLFTVAWSAGSDDLSGPAILFDVNYKDGAGAWTPWLDHFPGSSSQFTGVHNHTYYFEARVYDNAGNAEPFTGIAESQTLIDTFFVGPSFIPGDANNDGALNGIDVIYLVNYFKGLVPPPDPYLAADANGSCAVNGLDVTYLVNYFRGAGPAPFAGNCR